MVVVALPRPAGRMSVLIPAAVEGCSGDANLNLTWCPPALALWYRVGRSNCYPPLTEALYSTVSEID